MVAVSHPPDDVLAVIRRCFGYLEFEDGYRVTHALANEAAVSAIYVRPPTAVIVGIDLRDGVDTVELRQTTVEGLIEWHSSPIALNALLAIDGVPSAAVREAPARAAVGDETLVKRFDKLARYLRRHAADLLRGDWSRKPVIDSWNETGKWRVWQAGR